MTEHLVPQHDTHLAALRAEVEHLRARSAEAAALRGELLTLRAERQAQLERLQQQVARLAGAATSAQAKKVRQLNAELDKARAGEAHALRRAERLRKRVHALEASRSHRAAQYARRVVASLRPSPPSAPVPPPKKEGGKAAGTAGSGLASAGVPVDEPTPQAPAFLTPVMLDCRDLSRDDLTRALAEVGDSTRVSGTGVVVLIDSVDFDLPRSRGHLVEYVPPVDTVSRRVGENAAARLENSRWQQIVDSHRPREIYRVSGTGADLRLDLLVARPGSA